MFVFGLMVSFRLVFSFQASLLLGFKIINDFLNKLVYLLFAELFLCLFIPCNLIVLLNVVSHIFRNADVHVLLQLVLNLVLHPSDRSLGFFVSVFTLLNIF